MIDFEDDYTDLEDDDVDRAMKELEAFYAKPPSVVIGDGKNKETDLAEWSDPDEARYNAKMGLGKDGEPMPVDKVLDKRVTSGYHMALDEGYNILDMDGDDEGSSLTQFQPEGFNQW